MVAFAPIEITLHLVFLHCLAFNLSTGIVDISEHTTRAKKLRPLKRRPYKGSHYFESAIFMTASGPTTFWPKLQFLPILEPFRI